jgi:hypothetical protein
MKVSPQYCIFDCPIVLRVRVPEEPQLLTCERNECQKLHKRLPSGMIFSYEPRRDGESWGDRELVEIYSRKCYEDSRVCSVCYPRYCAYHQKKENESPTLGLVKIVLEKQI